MEGDFLIPGRWYALWHSQENVIDLLEEILEASGMLRTNWGTGGPANRELAEWESFLFGGAYLCSEGDLQ